MRREMGPASQAQTTKHTAKDRQTLPLERKAPLLLHAADARWLQGWQLHCLTAISSKSALNQCTENQCT